MQRLVIFSCLLFSICKFNWHYIKMYYFRLLVFLLLNCIIWLASWKGIITVGNGDIRSELNTVFNSLWLQYWRIVFCNHSFCCVRVRFSSMSAKFWVFVIPTFDQNNSICERWPMDYTLKALCVNDWTEQKIKKAFLHPLFFRKEHDWL